MAEKAADAVASIVVNAPRQEVWEALTTPELVKQYFLGTTVASTWEVGSPITFSGEWQGKSYQDHGVILASEPPGLLRYTHYSPSGGKPDEPENYHVVEYRVAEADAGSAVTITQANNSSESEVVESEKTWRLVLGNLKEFVESR
ncbi:SRPBCC domain-containing protein [Arthrobacter sp. M4]|uniref:SRPBCC family protein n=1 Tax=Arthrobacter sp. M4 TaxID=218160 RepID=UPI001CDD8CFC|nr:SRPBCC domain-containing protein [Arthrobacter sp. M4]MCA4131237.1 SRPBCC domain-containing protein [Arthrobacter sp. M4]